MTRNIMHSSDLCKACLKRKYIFETDKIEYLQKVNQLIDDPDVFDAAKMEECLVKIYNQYFTPKDYPAIKKHYNDLVLEYLNRLKDKINCAKDPLYTVIKMSLVSNYIDYSAFKDIDDNKLFELLTDVDKYDFKNYCDLKNSLANSKSLLYITDNCGEIVVDKLVIEQLKQNYPNLKVTAMVRGGEVCNDASMIDAKYIGLDKICTVIDNGLNSASSRPSDLPLDRQQLMNSVDIIISKGQANAETLSGCGLNVYYLLLCKCDNFAKIFNVEKLTPLIEKELT